MKGLIALLGSGEYLPIMNEVDRHLLSSVQNDGRAPQVVCLPTAAGEEGDESVNRWLRMGREHFEGLGAAVHPLQIIDRASADDPKYEQTIEQADLIYFSGGNPLYLYETMNGSRAWAAAHKAWDRGAVYAGCSAGAMILARRLPNFRRLGTSTVAGFGLVQADYVMPHFDHAGPFKFLLGVLRRGMKDNEYMLGIDEDTALVGHNGGEWRVMGVSTVHLITRNSEEVYSAGQVVPLPLPNERQRS
ncbi:MAG TPA: Type 1 glutamine amidotransferase-like domain-containing protein [Anaerolineales bacterium]|nr:Type 1 glutamine amidotransferase-like domain-containing protein [Anaerolineales bacterium]